jgi:hypothetical protein
MLSPLQYYLHFNFILSDTVPLLMGVDEEQAKKLSTEEKEYVLGRTTRKVMEKFGQVMEQVESGPAKDAEEKAKLVKKFADLRQEIKRNNEKVKAALKELKIDVPEPDTTEEIHELVKVVKNGDTGMKREIGPIRKRILERKHTANVFDRDTVILKFSFRVEGKTLPLEHKVEKKHASFGKTDDHFAACFSNSSEIGFCICVCLNSVTLKVRGAGGWGDPNQQF